MNAYRGTDNLEVMADARNYNRFLADLVLKHSGQSRRAVDFGAGIGTFALMLRERGIEPTCIEPDAAQRAVLREQGLTALEDINALGDGTFPYVYSLNVLEHIEKDEAAVAVLARKLCADGRLFIYVPAFEALFTSMDRKVGHFRRYRRAELIKLMESAGLTVTHARYVDSLGFLATLAYKLWGPDTGDLNRLSIIIFDRFVFPVSRLLDRMLGGILGKNAYVVARKRGVAEPNNSRWH